MVTLSFFSGSFPCGMVEVEGEVVADEEKEGCWRESSELGDEAFGDGIGAVKVVTDE